jgi:hypothetical protein
LIRSEGARPSRSDVRRSASLPPQSRKRLHAPVVRAACSRLQLFVDRAKWLEPVAFAAARFKISPSGPLVARSTESVAASCRRWAGGVIVAHIVLAIAIGVVGVVFLGAHIRPLAWIFGVDFSIRHILDGSISNRCRGASWGSSGRGSHRCPLAGLAPLRVSIAGAPAVTQNLAIITHSE